MLDPNEKNITSEKNSPEKNETSAHSWIARSFSSEIIRFVFIAVFVVLPIRIFIAQPFIVSGSSMDPTFKNGEYLIVDEISYRFEDPQRGDVVIFKYPLDTSKYFIKRIIGLPGEHLTITGNTIAVTSTKNPEVLRLDEAFLSHQTFGNVDIVLGKDEYFVMGDNRPASSDSRIWGPLKKEFITGRALVRLLPIKRTSLFPGSHTYLETNTTTTSTQ
ncbi:signal peptidase I [Candidatus Campbellbacteria bacterium]|nr:MAG: signal peptidase I [Candidatus Campbellbacteria bacterium]